MTLTELSAVFCANLFARRALCLLEAEETAMQTKTASAAAKQRHIGGY